MAIFSRRVLQYMINENAKILSKDQLDKHICDLIKEERFEVDGINRLVEVAQRFRHKTVNVSKFLHEARLKGQSILFEGAQGSGRRYCQR